VRGASLPSKGEARQWHPDTYKQHGDCIRVLHGVVRERDGGKAWRSKRGDLRSGEVPRIGQKWGVEGKPQTKGPGPAQSSAHGSETGRVRSAVDRRSQSVHGSNEAG